MRLSNGYIFFENLPNDRISRILEILQEDDKLYFTDFFDSDGGCCYGSLDIKREKREKLINLINIPE